MISCCSGHFVQRGAIEGGAAEGEVTEGHFTEGVVSQGDASEGVASEYSSERSAAVTESIEDEVVERGGVKEGVVVVGSTEDIFVADGTITAENGADTRRLRNGIASEVQALKQRITERSKKLARRIASRQPPAKPGANDSHRRVPEDDLSESQLAEEEPLQRLWQQDRLPERCFDPSLSSAAFSGTVETVEVFHSRGADMGSALCHVAQEGHLEAVKTLCEARAHLNCCERDGSTPLFFAAGYGHLEVARHLMAYQADCNIARSDGASPLLWPAQEGSTEMVKLLLSFRANPNQSLHDNCTPLIASARFGHMGVCKELLAHGAWRDAEVVGNAIIGYDGTAAQVAFQAGHSDLARILGISCPFPRIQRPCRDAILHLGTPHHHEFGVKDWASL